MAGIYVHIPFCASKCIYCAFYSIVNQRDKDKYIDYLIKEIDLKSAINRYLTFETLYFGGGTPSLLQIYDIERIVTSLRKNYDLGQIQEFTFEANPEQLDYDYCCRLKQLGINRLSIGVQSFDDRILSFLGRRHSKNDALNAIKNAKNADFDNISIDLIYGINERADDLWKSELDILNQLDISHFSAYALTLEENSILYRRVKNRKHDELDEDMASRQYEILTSFVEESYFQQYEVSNFAKNGFESKHNSSYWFGVPYIGFGPSAHSFDGCRRSWNAPNLKDYFVDIESGRPFSEEELLSNNDLFNEYILLRLRTREGISTEEIRTRFGAERSDNIDDFFGKSVDKKYYTIRGGDIVLTSAGFWRADGIAEGAFVV